MKEIWKDIEGYEGIYQVSNFGRIKSLEREEAVGGVIGKRIRKEIILKDRVCGMGYSGPILSKNGVKKSFRTHRLVAKAFIPNPKKFTEVNHKDGNRSNNVVYNLEWCSHSYNMKHAHKNNPNSWIKKEKLKRNKKVICIEKDVIYDNVKTASFYTGISLDNLYSCCSGRSATAGGYHWKYFQ